MAAAGSLPAAAPETDGRERLLRERDALLGELEEVYESYAALLGMSGTLRTLADPAPAARHARDEEEYARLEKAQEELIRGERLMAMGEMAAEIGHEINNYLTVLGGRAEMIGRALKRGDTPGAEKNVQLVLEQVAKMRRLTLNLMDFSRPDSERTPEDPAELVVDAVQLLAITARRAGVGLRAGCPGGLPAVHVDRAQIEQLLVNLIKNAIEAVGSRQGGRVLVVARYDPEREEMRFEVQDNGRGIAPEVRASLFQPHVTSKKGGRGFGLAVAHRVARNHGGRLDVDTEEGRGTTFVFALPVRAQVLDNELEAPVGARQLGEMGRAGTGAGGWPANPDAGEPGERA